MKNKANDVVFPLIVIKNKKKYSKVYYISQQLVVYTSNTKFFTLIIFNK